MIKGNTTASIEVMTTIKNTIGEKVRSWTHVQNLTGYLDLMSSDSRYTDYNAKIQESSHVFICDYVALDLAVKSMTCRMLIEGQVYDINFIDNPMHLNRQLEFYLKVTGD